MKFLTRLLKSTVCLIAIMGIMAMFTASPSLADKCNSNDRVELPRCVWKIQSEEQNKYGTIEIRNRCSKPVTLKFDRKGSDIRKEFPANMGVFTTVDVGSYKLKEVYCCPRYNECSFP